MRGSIHLVDVVQPKWCALTVSLLRLEFEIELVKGLLGVKSRFRKEPNFYAPANRHHQRVIVYLCSDPDLIPQAQYIVLPGFQPHWQQRPAPIFE